jgi:polysaccharide export outer membrane protein
MLIAKTRPMNAVLLTVAELCLCAAVAVAQYAGPTLTVPDRAAAAPTEAMQLSRLDATILPGDVIAITTLGAPELSSTTSIASGAITGGAGLAGGMRVSEQGNVFLPYLGAVQLAGLTTDQAAVLLRRNLKEGGFLADPQVTVQLVDSPTRVISVVGEVTRPAPVPAFGQLRLLDAISACGGFTPMASHTVQVIRTGIAAPITVELGSDPMHASQADIPLTAGDRLIVPKVGSIFVVGEVKTTLSFPASSNEPITVMRAITMAGGLKFSAALSQARIVRTNADNQRMEIPLDLKKLMHGQQQDQVLASNDILYVPSSALKATISAGGVGVMESVFYGAIYASSVLK